MTWWWLLLPLAAAAGTLLLAFAAWWAVDCWRERQDGEAVWREQPGISAALADELAARWDELMGRRR